MKHAIARCWILWGLCFLVPLSMAVEFTVREPRAPLYSGPDAGSDVLGHVTRGTTLTIQDRVGDWICVIPPESVDVWIYAELVRDGMVAVPRVKMRAGPGITYRTVGDLDAGTRLKVQGSEGDWLKVASTLSTRAWIQDAHGDGAPKVPVQVPVPVDVPVEPESPDPDPAPVTPRPDPAPVTPRQDVPPAVPSKPVVVEPPARTAFPATTTTTSTTTTTTTSTSTSTSTTTTTVPQMQFQDHESPPSKPASSDSGPVTVRGVLSPVPLAWMRPAPYQLIEEDSLGRHRVVCYVNGPLSLLKAHAGRSVNVTGRRLEVRGARQPVLEATTIVPAGR